MATPASISALSNAASGVGPLPTPRTSGVPVRKLLLVEGVDPYGRLQTLLGTVNPAPGNPVSPAHGTFFYADPVTERMARGTLGNTEVDLACALNQAGELDGMFDAGAAGRTPNESVPHAAVRAGRGAAQGRAMFVECGRCAAGHRARAVEQHRRGDQWRRASAGRGQRALHPALAHLWRGQHLRDVEDGRARHAVVVEPGHPVGGGAFEHPAGQHRSPQQRGEQCSGNPGPEVLFRNCAHETHFCTLRQAISNEISRTAA